MWVNMDIIAEKQLEISLKDLHKNGKMAIWKRTQKNF